MDTNREKVSYCIGLEAGKNIRGQFKDLDAKLLEKGFVDSLEDRTPALPNTEIDQILKALSQQIQEQQRAFVEQVAEKNRTEAGYFRKIPGALVFQPQEGPAALEHPGCPGGVPAGQASCRDHCGRYHPGPGRDRQCFRMQR